ncbi:MAG: response regulator [Sporomusaceae bacterium]|nr:response regulator [Sporomusaceae bacterium]
MSDIHVLIVEDDPMVAELNRRYLMKLQGILSITLAASVKEALQVLQCKKIDLILLDIYMPDTNGLQFLSILRKNNAKTDVIVVTASRDSMHIQEALRLGAVDYLVKPFEYTRVCEAIETYQSRRRIIKTEELDQKAIDRYLLHRPTEPEMPKGLDKVTLEHVRELVGQLTEPFTAEEAGALLGVSRITARRYLEYLVSRDEVQKDFSYGSVGRPVCKYTAVNNMN